MKRVVFFVSSFFLSLLLFAFVCPKNVLASCGNPIHQGVCNAPYSILCSNGVCCQTQAECSQPIPTPVPPDGDIASLSDLEPIFGNIVTDALGLAGIVLFVLLIFGGFKFITSGGDPKAVESAQKTLTSAIAGLIIILIAYLILVLIKTLTGVDVTSFSVTVP